MILKTDFLHTELPLFFKVSLFGTAFPKKFKNGDRLTIKNIKPGAHDTYILMKHQNGHEIVNTKKLQLGSRSDVIGVIVSYEQSCNPFWEPNIGTSAETARLPRTCMECALFELIQIGGKAWPYRLASNGLVKCSPVSGMINCSHNKCSGIKGRTGKISNLRRT